MKLDHVVADVQRLVDAIAPILAGNEPEIVGAALADLFSMLLAGFQGPGNDKLREEMIVAFVAMVRHLVPINEADMLAKIQAAQDRTQH